jgi:anti-anti-sigma regulatory factor
MSLAAVDLLARLQLGARRLGFEIRLRTAPAELRELISLVGLDDVLRVEPPRKSEERKERLGVEEEGDLGDPAA